LYVGDRIFIPLRGNRNCVLFLLLFFDINTELEERVYSCKSCLKELVGCFCDYFQYVRGKEVYEMIKFGKALGRKLRGKFIGTSF